MVVPPASSSSRPDVVCMSRTKSSICSSASAGGAITTSTPSPSWLSSKSVTSAATSMRASFSRDSPVISQSIQTMRSLTERSVGFCVTCTPYGHPRTRAPRRGARCTSLPVMTWGQEAGHAAGAPGAAPSGPVRHSGRGTLRRWLLAGVIVIGFALAAVVLAVYYGATLGVVTSLLAILLAAIPLGVVIPTFLWLDRFEAEPTRYLLVAFGWGALVAALLAGIFN